MNKRIQCPCCGRDLVIAVAVGRGTDGPEVAIIPKPSTVPADVLPGFEGPTAPRPYRPALTCGDKASG